MGNPNTPHLDDLETPTPARTHTALDFSGNHCKYDQSFHSREHRGSEAMLRGHNLADLQRQAEDRSSDVAIKLLAAAGLLGGSSLAAKQFAKERVSRRRFLQLLAASGAAAATFGKNPFQGEFTPDEAWAAMPQLADNTLPIEIVQQGGAQFTFWLGYDGRFPNGVESASTQQWGPANNPIGLPPQIAGSAVPNGYGMVPQDPSNPQSLLVPFMEKFGDRIMVIISNHGTNNHQNGRSKAVTGSDADMFPGVAALFAGENGAGTSLPYLVNNAQNYAGGVVAPSDLSDPTGLQRLAFPNRAVPTNADSNILVPSVDAMVMSTRVAALEALAKDPLTVPAVRRHAQLRLAAEGAREDLNGVLGLIDGINGNLNGFVNSARIAMAGRANGLVTSAFLRDGNGYDTHGQIQGANQMNNAQELMEGINQIMYYAANNTDLQGNSQPVKPLIRVATDFGRRPVNGDDSAHWVNGMTILIGDAVKDYLDSKGVKGPIKLGQVNDDLELVGPAAEQLNVEDVIAFVRQLQGLSITGPFAVNNTTAPNAVDNYVTSLSAA